MRIETERCRIRNFNESDVYALYCILSSPKVMKYIEPPFTEGKTKIFIENNGLIPSPLVYALEYKNNNKWQKPPYDFNTKKCRRAYFEL